MKKLKFALVGCGHIGKRHLEVIMNEPTAELIAICDIRPEVLSKLQARYPGLLTFTDYDEMLTKIDFDVISICTPHGLHAPMSIQAARQKKHILVKKPMSLYSNKAKEMIQAAKEEGVRLFVVKQNRFNRPINLTKKALEDGRLGKIYMVQSNVFWNRGDDYYNESDWKGKKDLEGGALYTQVSHFIDLLVWWFGALKDAKSITDTLKHKVEIEDCGVAALRFESGVIGSLNWSTCVYNVNYEGSILIIGENGTIKIGGRYLNKIEFWDVQSYPLPEDEAEGDDMSNNYGTYQGSSSNHDKLMTEMIGEIIEARKGLVEGEEGRLSIEAIERIYEAASKN